MRRAKVVDHRVDIIKKTFWVFVLDLLVNDMALDPSPQQLAMWLIQRGDHASRHSWVTPAGGFATDSDRAQAVFVALSKPKQFTRELSYTLFFSGKQRDISSKHAWDM